MKVIFLDFDGVLNSEEFFIMRPHSAEDKKGWTETDDFDPYAVKLLNQITNATGAKIVISSAWRINRTIEWLRALTYAVGVSGEVIDKTEHFNGEPRGNEIKSWVKGNPECEQFIILDDDSDMEETMPYLIQTGWKTGLTQYHVDKAISILNG